MWSRDYKIAFIAMLNMCICASNELFIISLSNTIPILSLTCVAVLYGITTPHDSCSVQIAKQRYNQLNQSLHASWFDIDLKFKHMQLRGLDKYCTPHITPYIYHAYNVANEIVAPFYVLWFCHKENLTSQLGESGAQCHYIFSNWTDRGAMSIDTRTWG